MFSLNRAPLKQPQFQSIVDESTPLGALVDHVWLPGIGGGVYGNDRKGRADLVSVVGSQSSIIRPQGIHYLGSSTGGLYGHIPPTMALPIILIVACYFNTSSAFWCPLSTWSELGGAGGTYATILLNNNNTNLLYTVRNNTGTVATCTTGSITNAGSGTFLCCVAQSIAANDHRFYVNGNKSTSSSNIGGLGWAWDMLCIGRSATSGSTPVQGPSLDGGVLFAAYGRTAIPEDFALELSRDHRLFWSMFPQKRHIYASIAAAAGGFIPIVGYGPGPGLQLAAGRGIAGE